MGQVRAQTVGYTSGSSLVRYRAILNIIVAHTQQLVSRFDSTSSVVVIDSLLKRERTENIYIYKRAERKRIKRKRMERKDSVLFKQGQGELFKRMSII